MSMAVVHIPEAEAARDLPGLLARVRAGEEIVIEKEAAPPLCCAWPPSVLCGGSPNRFA